jgi:hypothetical protein
MITGSCLCGSVRYKISGDIGDIVHCHCQKCRKAHGSAFSSVAAVNDESFTLLGKETLKGYESSLGKYRYFCLGCGTQIYAKRMNTEHIILRLGSVDSEITAAEKNHIWVSEKASWYTINSSLPECQEFE